MPVVLLSAGTRTASATPPGTPTSAYHAVTTRRLLDTRLGGFRKPSAGSTMSLEVPEALGAEAVVASITVTEPDGSGFISAYPKGSPQPLVSSIDFDAGAIISNQVTVPVDASGSFTIFTSNAAHLVVDLIGVYSPAAAAAAGRFVPLQPHRVLDTRQSEPLVGGISILVSPQVPDDAEAVVATLTVTETSGAGFLGAFPSNVPWPQTSTLNFEAANSTRAVLATIALGPDGAFRLQANVSTQVIVDVLGYFTGSSAPVARAGLFVPLVPTREFDTRETGNRLVAGGSITIRYALDPLAVLGNVVITDDRHAGFATVTPGASPSTATSSVNTDRANQSIAAAVVSAYIAGAGVTISTQQAAHLVFDIAGVYVTESGDAPAPVPSSVSLGTRESVDPFAGLTPAGLLARYGDATSTHAAVMTSDGVIHSFGETDVALPTASTIKALVMGCTFARFQDRGRSTLDGSTQALVQAMISVSDNDATTSLVNALGGTSGLLACGRRFGATTMIMSNNGWGVTQISPESFVTILRNVLRPESSVLNAGWVTQARMMMNSSNIAPDERWGVGAGRPAGSTYWVKNGWWTTAPGDFRYPGSRINSVGMVESGNEWWIIAIQGDRYSSQYRGIGATQLIASTVNANLANA